MFPSSKIGRELRNKVRIYTSTFQCLNYCKQMFIVQVEINNSMESSWSSGLPRRFVFHWIGYYYWVWTFVYKRSSNIEMYLRTLLRSSRPIFKLGNVIGKFATNLGPACWKWLEIYNKSLFYLKCRPVTSASGRFVRLGTVSRRWNMHMCSLLLLVKCITCGNTSVTLCFRRLCCLSQMDLLLMYQN